MLRNAKRHDIGAGIDEIRHCPNDRQPVGGQGDSAAEGPLKTKTISSGSSFEEIAGYSRAVVVEHERYAEVLISGCTGFDYTTMTISEDLEQQVRRCFINIADVLAKAGGDLSHLVRLRYYITDASYWDIAAPVFGDALAGARPAATCIVAGLVDPRMKIEIEADARIPR